MNRLKQFLYLDHRPIQVFMSFLWLFYGILLIIAEVPFVENPIDHFDQIPARLEGLLLVFIACLGFYGTLARNLKADFVFAVFSLYKNTVTFITIMLSVGLENSGWVNDLVQSLACIMLLNKNIMNFLYEKQVREAMFKELEIERERLENL